MPRKAMKCIVEIDLHVITCPGTFLRDYEYVYLHMEMLGLEARTKSVPPTFPLFFHERLRFERTFHDCTDPTLVASLLKGEDIVIELRQHTDYITDGKVIAHCSSNTHDYLYPAIPPYYGSGREILLYKTSKFKPIRVTGEPVKLEFSTKTVIKEVSDYDGSENVNQGGRVANAYTHRESPSDVSLLNRSKSKKSNLKKSVSQPDLTDEKEEFIIRRKDDTMIANRDFSSFVCPKPRRATSPTRSSMRRSVSPTRTKKTYGNTTVESIPAYSTTLRSIPSKHYRSITDPSRRSLFTPNSLRYALDDLNLSNSLRRHSYISPRQYYSTNLSAALDSSLRIQRRVDNVIKKRDYSLDSDVESDYSLDVLRESLRDERSALNDAIKEADREAFYRSLNKSR